MHTNCAFNFWNNGEEKQRFLELESIESKDYFFSDRSHESSKNYERSVMESSKWNWINIGEASEDAKEHGKVDWSGWILCTYP